MLRILLADDYRPIRKRLKQILEGEFQDIYIDEAEDTEKLLSKVDAADWDMIISDFSMPGKGGLESLEMIKKRHAHIPVLMFSIYPEEQFALRLLVAGAAGYLSKGAAPEIIIKAIKVILSGERYLANGITVPPHLLLNNKEEKLLRGLVHEEKIEDIAAALQLPQKELLALEQNLLEKMKFKTIHQLKKYARENNIV